MSDLVIDVRQLQVQFRAENQVNTAVDRIDFQLERGNTLGIVGESGSGKSVTSLALMGLVPKPGRVRAGEILFKSEPGGEAIDLESLPERERRTYRGGKIAMIFQEPMSSLNPVYNVDFQLTEAILLHQNISKAEAKKQAIARLEEVQLLPELMERYPHELSGGQLQRVMIAMAIASNPTLLIADEPTTALDVTVQAKILQLLRDLSQARQMSLIFITHDLGVIAELVDDVAVMYRGKIVEQGKIKNIFSNPQHPYTKGLLACRPRLEEKLVLLPTVADFMAITEDPETKEIVIQERQPDDSLQAQISLDEDKARLESLVSQEPLLSVQNLQVGYRKRGVLGIGGFNMAVNNVSFNLYPGETLGLVGESGCGKSTLARAILRLVQPLAGDVFFRGENIAKLPVRSKRLRQLRREMQIVFQNPYNSLNPRMSIGKAIAEPMVIHNLKRDKKKRLERVQYLLERVGLDPDWVNRYPHELSGGQRQRVCIARALAIEPQFIICDESVSALDVSVQAQVLNLLKELQSEFQLTYIFISHDLSVVKFMSDRIIVMNKGKIEEMGAAEQIYRDPQQDYTRQLISAIPKGF
ncbi:ABC transporter ATP-binding protein [[Limnothrix rosea] IAM M-220]|uniref:ABC transporter ATP-binding protein n=1 Tax=[Limnothrix rosea] IAM M-220 TaxID=454133 RepID=UPI00095C1F58|nr:ABC transporter ATP-binding protein [[Limnothrix rosea] IAM M-220]OKH18500.1 ABC transporter ATP-binding protein [[Limnothrix rosea] IAM M-220]